MSEENNYNMIRELQDRSEHHSDMIYNQLQPRIEALREVIHKVIDLIIKREHHIAQNDLTWFADGIYTDGLAKLRNSISPSILKKNLINAPYGDHIGKGSDGNRFPKSEEAFCKTDMEFIGDTRIKPTIDNEPTIDEVVKTANQTFKTIERELIGEFIEDLNSFWDEIDHGQSYEIVYQRYRGKLDGLQEKWQKRLEEGK